MPINFDDLYFIGDSYFTDCEKAKVFVDDALHGDKICVLSYTNDGEVPSPVYVVSLYGFKSLIDYHAKDDEVRVVLEAAVEGAVSCEDANARESLSIGLSKCATKNEARGLIEGFCAEWDYDLSKFFLTSEELRVFERLN